MNRKLVLIEDERDISEPLRFSLKNQGYEVFVAEDGVVGMELVRRRRPHIVLLDLMVPGIDGFDVCRRMKADPACRSIPIIMLTAKDDQTDIVLGLGLGADDYVTKPFSTKELLVRIEAVLKRGRLQEDLGNSRRIEIGDLVVDCERYEARLGERRLGLTATEFKILRTLASNPDCVFTRDDLLNESIGENAFVIDRNIDVHIRSIRKKLGRSNLIRTVRGVGYRLDTSRIVVEGV